MEIHARSRARLQRLPAPSPLHGLEAANTAHLQRREPAQEGKDEIIPSADDGIDPYAYISDLVVRAAHRRRGIGRDLLVRAEAFAREFGAKQVKVGVLVRNEATHTFYRTDGFRDYTVQLVKPVDSDTS
jgi:GNAT superfamily N-acetyltransferase